MLDVTMAAEQLFDNVSAFVTRSLRPLAARLAALESAGPVLVKGEKGDRGDDADTAALNSAMAATQVEVLELRAAIAELKAVPAVPGEKGDPGIPGKDADPPSAEQIAAAVAKHLEQHPPAPGERGKDAPPVEPAQIAEAAAAYLKANPPADGKPGESIKGDPGPTGRGIADALIGKDGELVVTFTDGATKAVGVVVGKDGVDAKGEPGTNGKDALGFDDFTETFEDGGRTVVRRYVSGDRSREFRHKTATLIYRGGFLDGTTYEPGDTVTYGGHLWHCHTETSADKPGDDRGKSWTMAVRKGKDGKDGVLLPPKPRETLSLR